MPKLYFNRLHLNINDNSPKSFFIIDGIKSVSSAPFNDYSYTFTDIEVKDDVYIKGYLVKYDPYGRGEVLDQSTGTVKKGGTVNNIVAKSFFLINIPEMVIAFEEIKSIISKRMFARMFLEIFKLNRKGFIFELSISAISEKYSFIERVRSIEKINKISITLVPSNPSNADLWRDTDERIRRNNITRYKEIQETVSDKGILIDEETIAKMAMSEDGYGVANAVGKDNEGNSVSITTSSKSQDVTCVLPENIERKGLLTIIDYLSNTFNKIKERTTHQE